MNIKTAAVPPSKQGEKLDCIIAHWVQFAPGHSGMYETVKELVKYEKRIPGVLAGIVEPMDKPKCRNGGQIDPIDTDIITQSWNWAFQQANIHMVHFMQHPYIRRLKPRIFVMHGSIEACLYSELDPPKHKFSSLSTAIAMLNSCDASIAIHKRQYNMFKAFDYGNKLSYIRRGIDLERWCPDGAKMNLNGEPAITYGEIWRHMKDPLVAMYGVYEFCKRHDKAKFHPFGCTYYVDTWNRMLQSSRFYEILGQHGIAGHQAFPEHWYRGADINISPVMNGEDSRAAVESLACGTPVIGWDTNQYNDFVPTRKAKAFDWFDLADQIADLWSELQSDREGVRTKCVEYARENFDMRYTAELVVRICRQIIGGEK